MNGADRDECLALACSAAREARTILGGHNETARRVFREEGKDIKIAADKLAEDAVLKKLRQGPDWDILSEEAGVLTAARGATHRWIVDPLDGTYNFTRGIPLYCCSIALWRGDQPVLGVILDLASGDMFTGSVGEGAFLNGQAIQVSTVARADRAVLSTGFPAAMEYGGDSYHRFQETMARFKKVRMLGSAALSLAYVACGRADIHFETNTRLWDVAAGIALVRAAGGRVDFKRTRDDTTLDLTAWNGVLQI